MRRFWLAAALTAAVLSSGQALAQGASSPIEDFYLDGPPRKPQPRPRVQAGSRPNYGGVYVAGQQVTELDCYSFDAYDVVVPNFGWFVNIEKLAIVVQVYSFDKKGRPLSNAPEFRQVLEFSGPRLLTLRRTFADKGYLVFSQKDLVATFNRHRRPPAGSVSTSPASGSAAALPATLNSLQYTQLPLARVAESVLFVDVLTRHISQTRPDGSPFRMQLLVYQSPQVTLRGRLVAPAPGNQPLPALMADSCRTNKGPFVPLATIRAVPFNGHGEKQVER